MLTESVAEASLSFPDVELGTFAARKDVNQITGRASELVLESELTLTALFLTEEETAV